MTTDYDKAYYESAERSRRRTKRRRVNLILLAIIGVSALACCSGVVLNFMHSNSALSNMPTAPVPGSSSAKAKVVAPPSPAGAKTLLTFPGSGVKKSPIFNTGAEWNVSYSFDCTKYGYDGNFVIMLYKGSNGDSDDILVNELARQGKDSTPIHHDPGSHYLAVDSECSWTVTVTG